jgi:N6-L-threonylcarbamoyladenine synthase
MRLQAGVQQALADYAFDVRPRWALEAVGAAAAAG